MLREKMKVIIARERSNMIFSFFKNEGCFYTNTNCKTQPIKNIQKNFPWENKQKNFFYQNN